MIVFGFMLPQRTRQEHGEAITLHRSFRFYALSGHWKSCGSKPSAACCLRRAASPHVCETQGLPLILTCRARSDMGLRWATAFLSTRACMNWPMVLRSLVVSQAHFALTLETTPQRLNQRSPAGKNRTLELNGKAYQGVCEIDRRSTLIPALLGGEPKLSEKLGLKILIDICNVVRQVNIRESVLTSLASQTIANSCSVFLHEMPNNEGKRK